MLDWPNIWRIVRNEGDLVDVELVAQTHPGTSRRVQTAVIRVLSFTIISITNHMIEIGFSLVFSQQIDFRHSILYNVVVW